MFKVEFVAKALKIRTDRSGEFKRIWTDTRSLQSGDLFAAVSGEKFEGHDFVLEAHKRGAKGAIVSQKAFKEREKLPKNFTIFEVPNTVQALRQIAQAHRRRLKATIFAVAGSNGKTTTKEWIAFLLSQIAGPENVFKTQKSNNSILGIALSLLQIKKEKFAVIEIGIDEPGWMDKHLEVVEPDGGVITSIGEEHLNHLKTIELVAQEELKLLSYLKKSQGLFAANLDCEWVKKSELPKNTLTYSLDSSADIEGLYERPNQLHAFGYEFTNPLAGKHNAQNLLAALTSLRLLVPDLQLDQIKMLKLSSALFRGEAHRGVWMSYDRGVRVLDDCYNANPDSMALAIQAFLELSDGCHQKLILGDMLDLGAASEKSHHRIFNLALVSDVDEIVLFGPKFENTLQSSQALLSAEQSRKIKSFIDLEDLKTHLRTSLRPEDNFLLKGSRGMALEKLLECFGGSPQHV